MFKQNIIIVLLLLYNITLMATPFNLKVG